MMVGCTFPISAQASPRRSLAQILTRYPSGLYTLSCLQKGQPCLYNGINGLTELILLCVQLVARTDHSWVNYVMASFKGVCGYVAAEKCQQITTGLNLMVEGQVPQGERNK